MPFVSTNNNHANQKTTCQLSFRSHVSYLFWETENKLWKVSGQTLSVSDILLVPYLRRLHKIPFQLPYKLCIFTFPLALGCPLKRASAVLSFIKKFLSKLALRNRFVHPFTVKKAKFSHSYWLKETFIICIVILRYKSDSPFNIINVAIISYSTDIRRVSKLLFLSYPYLLLIEKRPNFLILIGLFCIANFLRYTPSSRVFKIKLLGSQSCLTRRAKNFLILL